MAEKTKSKRGRDRPASDEQGELTLADVEWLDEHYDLPAFVIELLTQRVKDREDRESAEKGQAVPEPTDQQVALDDAIGVRATPKAAELAKAKNIPLAEIEATGHMGPDGRRKVIKADVKRAASKRAASA